MKELLTKPQSLHVRKQVILKRETIVIEFEVGFPVKVECGGACVKFIGPQDAGWVPSESDKRNSTIGKIYAAAIILVSAFLTFLAGKLFTPKKLTRKQRVSICTDILFT